MITSAQYAVTDTRTKIASSAVGHRTVHVAPVGNTSVYLGNATVTSTTGYILTKAAGQHDIILSPGDELYVICATGQTETVTVLISEN
jgi:hypothetical protein